MNKKVHGFLIILTIIISIAAGVNAQTASCTDTQTIMFLSSQTNAHVATNATSGYQERVCFEDLYGTTYQGTNPHQCNGKNTVIRVTNWNNAHAEAPEQNTQGYTDLCYGNMECTSRSLQNCQGEEQLVVSLYTSTNSHAMTTNGPINICCKITTITNGPHWEDLNGNQITTTDVGNTIKLVVPGVDLDQVAADYKIEQKTTSWIFFTSWSAVSTTSTKGEINWTPTSAGIYRFTVKIPQKQEEASPELTVTNTGANTPPTATIKGPIDRGIYLLNQTISYSADVTDPDDPTVSYDWDFGDGQKSTQTTPTHNYVRPGQKTIILTVTDSRGASSKARADILLVNSSYFLSYISSPTYNEQISGLNVDFDATQLSYAVEVTHTPFEIKCIAGNCPSTTADGSITVSGTPAAITNMNFSWTLSDGYKKIGLGSSNGAFSYQFSNPGEKSAIVNISIDPNSSSTTWTNFTNYLPNGVPYCSTSSNGQTSWVTSSGSTSSINDCYKANALANQQYCCPTGYACTQQQGTVGYRCLPGGPSLCSDYKTKTECSDYSNTVAEESVKSTSNGALICGTITKQYEENGQSVREITDNCRCEWDNTASQCKSQYDTIKECVDGSCGQTTIGSCQTTVTLAQDLCTTQKIKIYNLNAAWTGSGTAPTSCVSGTITKGCIDFSQVRLPFFSFWQLIITIIIIAGFYANKKRR